MSESRHLRSVSDLYAADEIEVLLLEEIRDLEPPPATYSRPEEIQDFEIAGSRTGGLISSQSSELDSLEVHSTVHSWDSHANYHDSYSNGNQRSSANAMPWPRASNLIFYCDIQGHLKTATGLVRLFLLFFSAACLATICSSGTAKVSLFMLPLVGRLRFMIFVAVFCLLITALLLFLDISHIVFFFPFNWARLNAWIFSGVGVSYITSSAMLTLSVVDSHGANWVPKRTRTQLTVSVVLGISCAFFAFLLSWLHRSSTSHCRTSSAGEGDLSQQLFKPVDKSLSGVILKDSICSAKQPPPWVAKNSRRHQACPDLGSGAQSDKPRKDHWASARDHFFSASQFVEEIEELHGQALASGVTDKQGEPERRRQRKQQRREPADGTSNSGNLTASQTKMSFSTDDSKKKAPAKKLPLQAGEKLVRSNRGFKEAAKKTTTRTSVTRSEIQEYWMQGYEHVQRTDKTTANIEQWQSAAMKSLEEKKAKDARWAESWRQKKEQAQLKPFASSEQQPDEVQATTQPKSQLHPQPCSSKTLEPLNFG